MARFFADENFPQPVVEELRRLGHDVLTTQEANLVGKAVSDEVILSYAAAEGRSVLTLNRKHFIHLHHVQLNHSGIIVCTFDFDFVTASKANSCRHWIVISPLWPPDPGESAWLGTDLT